MPYRHAPTPHGDYARLVEHLAGRADSPLTLGFAEVERIVGGLLPYRAKLGSAWWSGNDRQGRSVHRSAWQAAGWRVERVDEYAGTVTFARADPT